MEKLIAEMGSAHWWLSVVVVGLLLGTATNLGTAYLKPVLDRWLERRGHERLMRRVRKNVAFEHDAERLARSPSLLTIEAARNAKFQIGVAHAQLFAMLVIVIADNKSTAGVSLLIGASIMLMLSTWLLVKQRESSDLLALAREILHEEDDAQGAPCTSRAAPNRQAQ